MAKPWWYQCPCWKMSQIREWEWHCDWVAEQEFLKVVWSFLDQLEWEKLSPDACALIFSICSSNANPKKFCDLMLMSVIAASISLRMGVWEAGCDWETVKRETRMNKTQRSIWDQKSLQKWWWGWRWLAPSGVFQDMHYHRLVWK